jgi:hypothetical protein
VYKPEDAIIHEKFDLVMLPVQVHGINAFVNTSSTVLSGNGFAPGEIVSFWVDPPNGGCSNWTEHSAIEGVVDIPPGVNIDALIVENSPVSEWGVQRLGDAKAGADGSVAFNVYFDMSDCEGEYHLVARGNTSGWGADTYVTLIGNAVTADAWLTASPGAVSGLFDHIWFYGTGFAPGEHVSCWLTSPQGQTMSLPAFSGFNGNISAPGVFQSIHDRQVFADAGGNFAFDIVTGTFYASLHGAYDLGGLDLSNKTLKQPYQSEGAIGEYAASCRGDTSGSIGIARFWVTGNELTP